LMANNGHISNNDKGVNIDLLYGQLHASALTDININEVNGNMLFDIIKSSSGKVTLSTQNGSVIDINGELVDIIANELYINTNNIDGSLNLNISDSTELNTSNNASITGSTGDLIGNIGGSFLYSDITARNVDLFVKEKVELTNGFIFGNVNINNTNSETPALSGVEAGESVNNFVIYGDLSVNSTNDINILGDILSSVTLSGNNVAITELGDVSINSINTNNNAVISSVNSSIIDSSVDESSNVSGLNISLSSFGSIIGGIGDQGDADIDIDLIDNGLLTAMSLSGDVCINEINGDLYINSIDAGNNNVYINSDKGIYDGNVSSTEAKIKGNSISLIAGIDGSIGSADIDGVLEIDTSIDGFLTAIAETGSVYIKEVGYEPTINVSEVKAKNEVFLHADWKIQNFDGATISATDDNSIITLITDDTKLFDDNANTGGTITTGSNGIVIIGRESDGDIYASYEGPDNLIHPLSGETTYVTTRELNTICSNYIELDPKNGEGIWDDAPSLNIIIDDDYDFLNHPVDVGEGTIYILRETAGILILGGYIDGIGIITQTEIDNITADNILLGNVLDPTDYTFGDTIQINLLDPDFSQTSSTNGPSNVTLVTSGSIIDGDINVEGYLRANNLTLIADSNNDSSGGIGSNLPGENIDIALEPGATLNAQANNNIRIDERIGHMMLDKVISYQGSVDLRSYKNIIDYNNNSEANVIAGKDVYLQAGNYSLDRQYIGSADNFIEIDSAVNGNGYLSAFAGYIYIEEIAGNLNINRVVGKEISGVLESNKAAQMVVLKASDINANNGHGANILDFDIQKENLASDFNIHAIDLTLEAKYGSIGTGSLNDNGDIDLYGTNDTLFKAVAGTDDLYNEAETINIYLYGTDGGGEDLSVPGSLEAGAAIVTNDQSTVSLMTNRYILSGGSNLATDIEAKNIILSAGYGIGDGPYILTVKLLGNDGYLSAYGSTAGSNRVAITSVGDMRIKEIQGKYIQLTAIDGSITNAKLIGTNISKDSYKEGGSVTLTATNGNIGEVSNPIQLCMENSFIISKSGGDTYLNNTDTGGTIGVMQSYAGGDYQLTATNSIGLKNDTGLPTALLAEGDISLTSNVDIYDYTTSNAVLIQGNNINLSSTGNIGYNASYGIRYLDIKSAGALSVNSGSRTYLKFIDNINVDSINSVSSVVIYGTGDINLGNINAVNALIRIDTTGGIYNSTSSNSNIIGKDISLYADTSIGTIDNYLNIQYTGLAPVFEAPEIFINIK
ncbi:MAG: hypothetical protein AB1782_17625, partial [Cyanobacteriota bacterium]